MQIENSDELNHILAAEFAGRTTDEWIAELEPKGVLCARVNDFRTAADDPQVRHNGMIVELEHPRAGKLDVLGTPIRLGDTPPTHAGPPPDLGADSRAVLEELGYDAARLDDLQARNIIGGRP